MRRAGAAAVAAVVAATVVTALAGGPAARAATPPAGAVPAAASAAWLAGLLGPEAAVVDPALEVVDVDATLDLLLGLTASGGAGDVRDTVAARLAADAELHTGGTIGATFVSVTAKLVLALDAAGRDPRDAGGTDLVALLAARVGADGRAADRSDLGDLSTPASQALTVLALDRTGTDPALVLRAADALATAACLDGGLPAEFGADPCTTDPVATALGAAALAAAADAAGADVALGAGRDDALAVLLSLDAAGDLDPWPAGLTATALRAAGRDDAATALTTALVARVDGCDGGATAAVTSSPDPLRATVGVLLATAATTLTELDGTGAAPGLEPLGCGTTGDDTTGGAGGADGTGSVDPVTADGDASGAGGGTAPDRGIAVTVAGLVLALALLAGIPVVRRAQRRDRADRAAARGA